MAQIDVEKRRYPDFQPNRTLDKIRRILAGVSIAVGAYVVAEKTCSFLRAGSGSECRYVQAYGDKPDEVPHVGDVVFTSRKPQGPQQAEMMRVRLTGKANTSGGVPVSYYYVIEIDSNGSPIGLADARTVDQLFTQVP